MWDKYIAFEEEQGNKKGLAALYARVVAQPLRDLEKYVTAMKVGSHGCCAFARVVRVNSVDGRGAWCG
eukprot:121485-Chlamydomonas_euryale.AAC.1